MPFFKVRFAHLPSKRSLEDFLANRDGGLLELDKSSALVEFMDDPNFPIDTNGVKEVFVEFEGPKVLDVKKVHVSTEYIEPAISTAGKVAVNLGAGRERIPGFLRLDMPATESISYEYAEELIPDIAAQLPDLPFDDESVDVFRMRDVLIEGEVEASELGPEVRRKLKPGGLFVTLEHETFKRAFSRWLKIKSIEKAGKVPYAPGFFWRTVYQKT